MGAMPWLTQRAADFGAIGKEQEREVIANSAFCQATQASACPQY